MKTILKPYQRSYKLQAMSKKNLGFKFAEQLPWQHEERTITSTLEDLAVKFQEQIDSKEAGFQQRLSMAIDYVYKSNLGESVGIQNLGEIRILVQRLATSKEAVVGAGREEIESINTYYALLRVEELVGEMGRGLLTVQIVCSIHEMLLKGLHQTAGKIRDCDVYTILEDGSRHTYPSPDILEDRFYSIIDRHNIHISGVEKLQNQEKVEYVFKCAAWLLFHLVSLHPFADGNGRTCRLLVSYVISSLITPFPVSLCHDNPQSCRRDYIRAIVRCRLNPEEGPAELASLLVEGAYLGWKQFLLHS